MSTFKNRSEFIKAIQAVAAEAGVPSSVVCITSDQDEDFDGESRWKIRFNEGGPVINIIEHIDYHADDEEDGSYQTAALLDKDMAASPYSFSRCWPRSMLFDLREKLIPNYNNTVIDTPDGFKWTVTRGDVTLALPVNVKQPEDGRPAEKDAFEFDWFDEGVKAFFGLNEDPTCDRDYFVWEGKMSEKLDALTTTHNWWMVEGDSFGPLIRGCRMYLANGQMIVGYYG
jgi:hypothetical protein